MGSKNWFVVGCSVIDLDVLRVEGFEIHLEAHKSVTNHDLLDAMSKTTTDATDAFEAEQEKELARWRDKWKSAKYGKSGTGGDLSFTGEVFEHDHDERAAEKADEEPPKPQTSLARMYGHHHRSSRPTEHG